MSWANSEDVKEKYEAMNWHYIKVTDGNDIEAIDEAINVAKGHKGKPSIVEIKTIIGYGASNQGDSATHGAPLGKDEVIAMKKRMGYTFEEFEAPEEAYADFFKNTVQRGETACNEWELLFEDYKKDYPELAVQLEEIMNGNIALDFESVLPLSPIETKQTNR